METPEDYIGQVIDIYSENVAAIVHPDGTEELAHGKYTIDGKYKVIDYDEGNNEFALITEEDAQRGEEGLDFTPYVYYVEADSVGGYAFDYEEHGNPEHDEIKTLYEQYGMPAVEHPLGEHTGAMDVDIPFNEFVELNNVRAVVRDGQPPVYTEHEFSLTGTFEIIDYNDETHEIGVITEADSVADNMSATIYYVKYDDILGNKQTPAATAEIDQLEKAFSEPTVEHPLGEHTGNQGYDIEAYANVPEEFNQKLIEIMGHMRAAGVPQDRIMHEIRDLIDIYVNSNPNNNQSISKVITMDRKESADALPMPEPGELVAGQADLNPYTETDEDNHFRPIDMNNMEDMEYLNELLEKMRAEGKSDEEIDAFFDQALAGHRQIQRDRGDQQRWTSVETSRMGAPDDHFISAMTPAELNKHLAADLSNEPVPTQGFPEQNVEPQVMPEEPEGLDEIAEPTAVEKVEEYLSNMHSEGTEFWNYINDAEMSLMKGDIEGAQADLRIMVEILNNLNQQLDSGRTAKLAGGMDDWANVDRIPNDVYQQIVNSDEVAEIVGEIPDSGRSNEEIVAGLENQFGIDRDILNSIINIEYKHKWSKTGSRNIYAELGLKRGFPKS